MTSAAQRLVAESLRLLDCKQPTGNSLFSTDNSLSVRLHCAISRLRKRREGTLFTCCSRSLSEDRDCVSVYVSW